MNTTKLLKTMFKALDTKDKTSEYITGFIHCHNNDGVITMTATNGHILLKTEILEDQLRVIGKIPATIYFRIIPNEVFAKLDSYNDHCYYDTVQRVIPSEYSTTETYISFDPKYLTIAKEFLQITDDNTKLHLPHAQSQRPLDKEAAQIFKSKSTNSLVLQMPLRHKEN
jgi:hypothetical protein